ncbi:hypothetical protein N0V90_004705 [Kalmusia sp. IMI 367209]|nr:hypothetical protein N0V90_004705 [Kalmusia sp. IMI 367209]
MRRSISAKGKQPATPPPLDISRSFSRTDKDPVSDRDPESADSDSSIWSYDSEFLISDTENYIASVKERALEDIYKVDYKGMQWWTTGPFEPLPTEVEPQSASPPQQAESSATARKHMREESSLEESPGSSDTGSDADFLPAPVSAIAVGMRTTEKYNISGEDYIAEKFWKQLGLSVQQTRWRYANYDDAEVIKADWICAEDLCSSSEFC